MSQVVLTPEQQFYMTKLLGFNYEIVYRPGKLNQVADALSRKEELTTEATLQTYSTIQSPLISQIVELNQSQSEMQELHQQLANGVLDSSFSTWEGMITCNSRVWVPDNEAIRS